LARGRMDAVLGWNLVLSLPVILAILRDGRN
jgi:hypothetical protein